MTIGATVTGPTKAATTVRDAVYYTIRGGSLLARYEYAHTNNTGAASGSGDYLFTLPAGLSADTAIVSVNTSASYERGNGVIGQGQCGVGGSIGYWAICKLYDATRFRAVSNNNLFVGSGHFTMTGGEIYYNFTIEVPISGATGTSRFSTFSVS
jgi:hypothetical protein